MVRLEAFVYLVHFIFKSWKLRNVNQEIAIINEKLSRTGKYYSIIGKKLAGDEILVLKIHHLSSLFSLFLPFLEEESKEHKHTNKKQTIHINNSQDLWSLLQVSTQT